MGAALIYEIRVEEYLTERWSGWFEGLAIRSEASGQTCLSGAMRDQAELLGVLARLHALNLHIVSVNRAPREE